jgi:hypothetical protein
MDGKTSIPPELAEFDITNAVVNFCPEPFVGIYFDIYRGAWKLDTPRIFQHVVAIKVLRPLKALDNAQEQLVLVGRCSARHVRVLLEGREWLDKKNK